MAGRSNKKKNVNTTASIITFGACVALLAIVFKPHQGWTLALMLGASLLASWLVGVMSKPMNLKAPSSSKEKEQQDLLDFEPTGNTEVDELVRRSKELLVQIRRENDLIPDQALSNQLYQLEEVSAQIFATVIEQPAKATQIRKFMNYYLPTTLKMLAGYRKMDERGVNGQNADAARTRIRNAMGLVLKAFKKQLETLYQNDMLDITTDVDVLEQMLKRDGLSDEGTMAHEFTVQQNAQKAAQTVADAQDAAEELERRAAMQSGPIVMELPTQKQKEEVKP